MQNPDDNLPGSPVVAKDKAADNCSACGYPLGEAQFCKRCGPPQLPPEEDEYRMSSGKALASIILMVASFIAIAITKLDIELNLFASQPEVEPVVAAEKRPPGKSFEVINVVNVPMANVRKTPSPDSIIIMVLKKDEQIRILEIKGRWSHIAAHDKTGWIFHELVTAQAE